MFTADRFGVSRSTRCISVIVLVVAGISFLQYTLYTQQIYETVKEFPVAHPAVDSAPNALHRSPENEVINKTVFIDPMEKNKKPFKMPSFASRAKEIRLAMANLQRKIDDIITKIKRDYNPDVMVNNKSSNRTQIVLVSGWRSGSSFTYEIFASHPHVFDLFEPLLAYKSLSVMKLRSWSGAAYSYEFVRDLLNCKFVDNPIATQISGNKLIVRRSKLYKYCENVDPTKYICSNQKYLEAVCSIFPITLVKFVRIEVGLMKQLLEDPTVENLHVIVLVRDPRAVMSSRWNKKKTGWCVGPVCPNEQVYCDDIDKDLTDARDLHRLYPDRVHLVRFEDIALNPVNISSALYDSVGMSFTKQIRKYIDSHTTVDSNKAETTFKVSKSRVISWVNDTDWRNIEKVQAACEKTMERYGYSLAHSKSDVTVTNMIRPFDPFPSNE